MFVFSILDEKKAKSNEGGDKNISENKFLTNYWKGNDGDQNGILYQFLEKLRATI